MKFLLHGGRSQEGRPFAGSELNGENGIEVRNCLGPACPVGLPVKLPFLAPFSPFPSHTHAQSQSQKLDERGRGGQTGVVSRQSAH